MHHLHYLDFLNHIPLPNWLQQERAQLATRCKQKEERTFKSFDLALERLEKETGLFYLHLHPTYGLNTTITLIDPLGIAHKVYLDHIPFALQHKGELAQPVIHRLMRQGHVDEAKRRIDSLIDLILERAKKGVADRDPVVRRNFGFLEDRAFEIDLGSFSDMSHLALPRYYRQDIFFSTMKFKKWLIRHYPVLASHLESKIMEILLGDDLDL